MFLYMNVHYIKTAAVYATTEEGSGFEQMIETQITSVELVGGDFPCEIMDRLSEEQIIHLIRKIQEDL